MLILNEAMKSILYNKIILRIEEIKNKTSNNLDFKYQKNSYDNEDILRILMVKYFPKIQKNSFENDLDKIYKLIFSIDKNIIIKDIRYFDMYNNFYEVIKDDSKNYIYFLNNYYHILLEYKKALL